MKKLLLTITILLIATSAYAQNRSAIQSTTLAGFSSVDASGETISTAVDLNRSPTIGYFSLSATVSGSGGCQFYYCPGTSSAEAEACTLGAYPVTMTKAGYSDFAVNAAPLSLTSATGYTMFAPNLARYISIRAVEGYGQDATISGILTRQ